MNLLSSKDLNAAQMRTLFERADRLQPVSERLEPISNELAGKTVCNLFFEDSTRTRLSFETAARRLGAEVLTFTVGNSSVKKGESLKDTVLTLEAMGLDAFVVRDKTGGPQDVAQFTELHVVNAGDGTNQHPTQALLDCFSIREVVKTDDFSDIRVAIVGDIAHSRCARSDSAAMTALGAHVSLIGPQELLPENVNGWGASDSQVTLTTDVTALESADFIYMLRMQYERQNDQYDATNYLNNYGMNSDRLKTLKPDVMVAHHGPMNRGIEISDDVADQFQDFVTRHVTNGVTVRMAVLSTLLEASND